MTKRRFIVGFLPVAFAVDAALAYAMHFSVGWPSLHAVLVLAWLSIWGLLAGTTMYLLAHVQRGSGHG